MLQNTTIMLRIDSTDKNLTLLFNQDEWRSPGELVFCKKDLQIPNLQPPPVLGGTPRLPMIINNKPADVLFVEDYSMGGIRTILAQDKIASLRQYHLFILNVEDFPEINGHLYLCYNLMMDETRRLVFLLLRKNRPAKD